MSGVATLVLSGTEVSIIDQHLKCTYQSVQKLHPKTPDAFVYFLGGCLPGEAEIHVRMLGIFGMVARLSDDLLRIHARKVHISKKPSSKSWFWQIRDICLKYELPHPIIILDSQPSKESFKNLFLPKVINYWENKLRGEAELLPSLAKFRPEFMSLKTPHPIWTTVDSNPYEISKAVQQARFLSGRYRTELLSRHWSKNKDGFCLSPACNEVEETVEHILVHCKEYSDCKKRLYSLWLSTPNDVVRRLVLEAFSEESSYLLQFILDCSVQT